ncbi:MAG TPA: S8 family serine peptidase [Gemmatimonadaceae bacterium]|nr:S8 family serine peptidase [Gemmatimonadaceae bacterium]
MSQAVRLSLCCSTVALLGIAGGCSDSSSTTGTSGGPSIAGTVVIAPGNARLSGQRNSGSRISARERPPVIAPARALRAPRYDIVFREEALGVATGTLMRTTSLSRAADVARTIHSHLATHPMAKLITVTDVSPLLGAARFRVNDARMTDSVLRTLRTDPRVASVSEDGLMSHPTVQRAKIDPGLLVRPGGPSISTTPGAEDLHFAPVGAMHIQYWHYNMIDAPRAWSVTTGSAAVTVAVIDEGIRPHPDIVNNLDMAGGYDFVEDDTGQFPPQPFCSGGTFTNFDDDDQPGPDPDPTMPTSVFYDTQDFATPCWVVADYSDHGLHVAGTIGAGGNANASVTGMSWTVKIRPIRALGIDGSGYDFDIAQAILYAAGLPAQGAGGAMVRAPDRAPIINMSLGGGNSSVVATAVSAAVAAGSLIIAAAGNASTAQPFYPAAYSGVIAVGALGPDGNLATYSNVGSYVSLVAPGGDFRFDTFSDTGTAGTGGVLSTTWNFTTGTPSYAYYTGTSMATPHVAGVAALILAQNPGFTADQIKDRLFSTAIDMGPPGPDNIYGYGLVDAYAAVTGSAAPSPKTYVRAINASTGAVAKTVQAGDDGSFAFSDLSAGSYYVVAGQDDNNDQVIGFPGRRFGWAGQGMAVPVTAGSQSTVTSVMIGTPLDVQTNVDAAHAQPLFVDSWVLGSIARASGLHYYKFVAPAAGTYTIETSGAIGACGLALELNTTISLSSVVGGIPGSDIASNDNTSFYAAPGTMTFPGTRCSKITETLQPGTYIVKVGWSSTPGSNAGTYRLHIRAGS